MSDNRAKNNAWNIGLDLMEGDFEMAFTSSRLCALMITSALVSVSAATAAQAQTAPQQPAAESGIEDIVVTARKTAEASQTVPVSITALSQVAIERKIVLGAQDLQLSVPGLFVAPNSQGGAPTFAIRAAKQDNGTSATVTTYINDMPTSSTLAISRMIYDMQSVSTLKGPQGTLFGANSTGGAIIFRPNTPTDKLEGYLEGGYGNFNRKTLQGVINLPVNDMFAMRVAGDFVRRDGFIHNTATPAQRGRASARLNSNRYESGRFSAKFTPSDAIQNDTMIGYFHENDDPNQGITVNLRPRFIYNTFLGIPVPVDYARAGQTVSADPYHVKVGSDPTYNRASIWTATNATTVDLSANLSAKLALGYERDRLDTFDNNGGTVAQLVNGRTKDSMRQYTIEPSIDYNGADGKLRVKIGAFYSNLKRRTGNSYAVIGLPFDLTGFPAAAVGAVNSFLPLLNASFYSRDLNSKALFSQASYDVSDTLTATLGARYTWDKGNYRI